MISFIRTPDYAVGDTIRYTDFSGGFRYVVVDSKEADVKNGRPGFDGRLVDTEGQPVMDNWSREQMTVWGYDSQIR